MQAEKSGALPRQKWRNIDAANPTQRFLLSSAGVAAAVAIRPARTFPGSTHKKSEQCCDCLSRPCRSLLAIGPHLKLAVIHRVS
jgi:hypothetical protein